MSEDKLNKNKKAEESSEQKAHVEFVKGKTPVNIDYYIKNKTTGEQITHEQMLESKDIKGNFEIWSYAPNGEKYLVGLAELDGNGGRHVEKHLTSLDGTVTDMVFADEPTGALDSKSSDELLSLFKKVNQMGQTILMVTHSTKAASNASRVLFIKDGVIFHQIYKGESTDRQMYQKISDTLTLLAQGGDK
jgi:ABC-type enterochelin transport system ATPase subunit